MHQWDNWFLRLHDYKVTSSLYLLGYTITNVKKKEGYIES